MAGDRDNGQWDEWLSALADGEVDRAQCSRLVDRLLADTELQQRWERFHVARAHIQGASVRAVAPEFGARVRAAVAREQPIVAPAPAPPRRSPRRWARPLAGVAIAAGLAGLALGVAVHLQQGGLQRALPGAGVDARAVLANGVAATAPLAGVDVYATGTGATSRRVVRERLSMYLISHNRFAGALDMPSVVPASRMAGFNAGH